MSYGLVGDNTDTYGPTIQGMRLLREAVLYKNAEYPTLANFVTMGETNQPQSLAIECSRYSKTIQDPQLKSTVVNLMMAALSSKERLALC